jgi:hypothetical protein
MGQAKIKRERQLAKRRTLAQQPEPGVYVPNVELIGCEKFQPYSLIEAIQEEMLQDLRRPDYRQGYALHEAGHYIFFLAAGIKEFVFTKPKITIVSGKPFPEMAGVIPIFDPAQLKFAYWKDGADALARAAAAGGQFSRYFTPNIDPGEERDYSNFANQCETWRQQGFPINTEKFWVDGQTHVKQVLQNTEFVMVLHTERSSIFRSLYRSAL